MPQETDSDIPRLGQAAQALDIGQAVQAQRGYGIARGCRPAKDGPLRIRTARGEFYAGGSHFETGEQTVTLDPGDAEPRKDLVYFNENGTLSAQAGTPAEPRGPETAAFSSNPFDFWQPSPPDMGQINGTPVAEVVVSEAATDFNEIREFRRRRVFADYMAYRVSADRQLLLPKFDSTADAPEIDRNLIVISGDGPDAAGLYRRDESTYARVAGGGSLSGVQIDAAKDWGGFDITNVGDFDSGSVATSRYAAPGGGGFLSRMGHHVNYGQTSTGPEEIARFTLDSNERLAVYRLEVQFKGGGTNSNFTVQVRDTGSGTVLARTSSRLIAGDEPLGESSPGATIALEYENETDAPRDVCISGIDTIRRG